MDNFVYFFVYYPSKKKEDSDDIIFVAPENKEQKPQCIYKDEIFENRTYYYKKVFKANKSSGKGKKATNFYFEFEIGDYRYIIKFDSKGNTFIYDVSLEVGKRRIDILRNVNQSIIEYTEKLDIFEEALKKNGEDNKIDDLFTETIDLYSKKKGFCLLISLFLKIYIKKDLCSKLLKLFKDMNENPKDNEKNMDRKSCLKDCASVFKKIVSEANHLIENNEYNPIDYYGIILCYLNYYDYDEFIKVMKDLSNKKPENLYEILLIYISHFKYPINENLEFFNKFINYAILKKEFSVFQNGLSYIKDLDTYLSVIEGNKEGFNERYIKSFDEQKREKHIIKLDKNLKIKKQAENYEIPKENNIKDTNDEYCIISKGEENNSGKTISLKQYKEENDKKVEKKNEKSIIIGIIKKINSIINFSKDEKIFIVFFTNDFWKNLLTYNSEPNQDNIYFCSKIRETFIRYYNLVRDIFQKKIKFTIKNEAINYYDRDEFAFILDQMIRQYINIDKDMPNIEKLAYITQYNPYYNEEKYYNKVDAEIFDNFNLNNVDNDFIEDFRKMNFELIFKENINEYINKIMSKIKNINDFDAIIKLINIKNISEKRIFLDVLNKKYDSIIKTDIGLLTGEKLNEAITIVAKIALINFVLEKEEKDGKDEEKLKNKFNFIRSKVKKLNKEIIPLIFIEIIKMCIEKENKLKNEEENEEKDDERETTISNEENFKPMKEFIFNEFTKRLDSEVDIDNIIKLLNCLEGNFQKEDKNSEDKNNSTNNQNDENNDKEIIINEFLKKLMENNLFTKEEFFSNNKNLKILLLYKLNEAGKIKKNNEDYYMNIEQTLEDIRKDIIDGNIQKKRLDEFLKNNETVIIQRLSLIKLILDTFKPKDEYPKLKKQNEEINEIITKLNNIKDNIIIYYKDTEQERIKRLIETINGNRNKRINQFKGQQIKELIDDNLQKKSDQINEVKHFLLFNVIYDMNAGKDEIYNFNNAYTILGEIKDEIKKVGIIQLYKKYNEIFDRIKEKLSNNEEIAQKFIQDFIKYFEINDKKLIDELTILFKSKKYEMDINSMIFFFDYFEKDNQSWNKKLSKEYENLSEIKDFTVIQNKLLELKKNQIYNYKNIQNYNKLFTCLYEKKEAMEFLFTKTGKDIEILKDRIQPTDRTISIKDIIDTEKCNSEIIKMKKIKDNDKIFSYIQSMNESTIEQFENYSKIYESVIELDRNDEDSDNLYEQVINIIKDASFNIFQDSEKFMFRKDNNNEKINKEELIHLKNRIHIKNENDDNKNTGEDKLKLKRKILIFYKNIISNLEIILEYMNVLRNKGSSLPIKINMEIKVEKDEPSVIYYLENKKETFNEIRNFLFDAKTSYISQLESMYKEKLNLRFLYGKQFRSIMKHLESNINMDSFLRYILNNTDNNKKVEEGYKAVVRKVHDYINQYEMFNKDSLENISEYITSLFKNNGSQLEEHYNKMRIIQSNRSAKGSMTNETEVKHFDKGIYLYECGNDSMEEFIINLFWDKTNELPIAQNVLITNKETSTEEIQAFFHRAILCNYNTLFVVEINDSFSDYQQSKMNNYIDSLLSYKNQRYNEDTNKNVEKKKPQDYLDSCIVFVYDKNNKNITSFLKEIRKLDVKNIKDDKINKISSEDKDKKTNFISELGNIMVITSEICGLGKSEKIKKLIKDNKKKYYHFPLGGILKKNDIFDKLQNLLDKIKNENYKDIAIHLDLTESKEKSIINEFFFSFLVTKFYTNNENIIYIPKDISIYIEIPNCFENYLSKFGILNIFNKENITFENMPPFNYPPEMIDIFNRMLGIKSNTEIQTFVQKYIGIPKYSYHQINIFIKLFISQYSKFKTKIKFLENGKDVTEKNIQQFALCTKYFTNGGFAQLLTDNEIKINEANDYIDKLSAVYDNDLHRDFPTPLIFIIKEKMVYDELYIPTKENNDYKSCKDYLKRIKEILNLPNEVEIDKDNYKSLLSLIEEKNENYVITNDNFKKMVLLVYRIKANVPVIIMGDTGCGKTALISKLYQILNNGKKMKARSDKDKKDGSPSNIINIHPGITDEKLCEIMKEKNEEAEKQKDEEFWLFFDEMNTCLSMSLITEIFINRTYNGNKLCDNIRLIGACNPYRKRKGNKEKCGLSKSEDNDEELVYLVEPLPQSLLYYVFSFGSIDDNDEKKYIHSIIERLFTKEEKILHELTRDAISQCHIYLRNTFDPSVVSLREIARFAKCIEFFNNYLTKKNKYLKRVNNEKNNKLRSIICSIYLCYYIRLTDEKKRTNFEGTLRCILLKLINNDKNMEEKGGNLIEQIKIEELNDEILRNHESINKFSDFLRVEQDFLLDQIKLDKGIGKNTLLKENVFLLFLAVTTNIPLIIIGKPGTGKSLSAQLIYKSMRGKYSKNQFFQLFPQIIQVYFQGSESSEPEDVENLFDRAKIKLNHFIKEKEKSKEKNETPEELPIIMVLFDELGLAERSKKNPLKVLHSKLEYSGKDEGVSFIGISNYSLDAAKINRALVLSVPDLDQRLDEIILTSSNIVESISEKLKKDPIFAILSRTYFDYKNELQFVKELMVYKQYKNNNNNNQEEITTSEQREKRQFESIKKEKEFISLLKKEKKIWKDFHGNRDFYNLIKGIALELGRSGEINNTEKVPIIIKYIERNFGGIEYEIDIDFNLALDDIRENLRTFKALVEDYEFYDEMQSFKLNSVFLFKKLYNSQFVKDPNNNLRIKMEEVNNYNLNGCINDNIKDINSRYLFLQVKPSLTTLIYQNIKLQNPFKDIRLYDGSPFIDDNNKEYRFKKINQIQDDARYDKLIVLENLNQIHPFLFDLYNRNYIIKDDKKFIRICLENANEQLTLVDDNFRIIILFDKKYINQCDLAFLNRLEKMILSFDKLLDNKLKTIANNLIKDLRFKSIIKKYKNVNYSLKDLLINCGNEDIQGLIYYLAKESKKNDEIDNEDIKEENFDENLLRGKVIDKLYKILPQDIICILPDNNAIKLKYNELKNIYNFKEYINREYTKKEESLRYKISIIYTYTSIANVIEGQNRGTRFMISEIRSEDGMKNLIEEIKKKNEYNKLEKDYYISIHFQSTNSKNIKFVSNFILNTFKNDNYIYIFIIHINRNFNGKNGERIYSLPDINPSINQIFIDNLNGNNDMKLNELLTQDIKDIIKNKKDVLKLDDEFNKILCNFLNKELNEKLLNDENDDYINNIINYMKENESIKEKIMEFVYKLIDEAKDEEVNCRDIVKKMFEKNYISKFTLDITTCLIDYIKDNIFNEYLVEVFKILEDNNIFTTLYENIKNNFKFVDKSLSENIIIKYLYETGKKDNYSYKFLYNYNIPGFYNFYSKISSYINKNITISYFNNEQKLRELLKQDVDKIRDFYEKEETLLMSVFNEISNNNKFIIEFIDKIKEDLILKDYITFFLQKYKNKYEVYNKDDKYHKLIDILLKLRFNDEKSIINNNKENKINILLIKIMWIESNINYILDMIKIFEISVQIFNDNHDKLLKNIEELIFKEQSIKYITNEEKNPSHTKEVNECYYILLASLCYCITSDEVNLIDLNTHKKNEETDIEINLYCFLLKEINKILLKLNDDLYIYLNELYIIDEFIQIIELFKKSNNIEKINKIKNYIRENALIIQKNSNDKNNDTFNLSEELNNNFDKLYKLIMENDKVIKKDKIFYDKVRYIFFKEIKKIPEINYRFTILEKILEQNEMIKKSNDLFQIILKSYLKTNEYFKNRDNILNGKDIIIQLLEKKLNSNNYVLAETLLYLFEKNSMIYLKNILNVKKDKKVEINLEDEPLETFKKCVEFLDYYIFNPKIVESKMKETAKLFCLGYIKVYLYTFIKMFDDKNPKFKDPKKIITVFNGNNTIYKMIRIYVYKILYNKYKINAFTEQKNIEKFKLKDYTDFNKIIKTNELINIYKIDYKIKTLKEGAYNDAYKVIEKYKSKDYKNSIKTDDFDLEDLGIDNFYAVSFNSILSDLQMENSKGNDNFYKNICEPLFKNEKLLNIIKLFYDPKKYNEIKKSNEINSVNFKAILFGYRFCLNEVFNKNSRGIYYPLYDSKNINYLKDKFYPGNDTKFNLAYYDVINHFKSKPEEGCYVCLCEKSYYHSVPSFFIGNRQLDMICPGCKKNIGAIHKGRDIISVKRENYYLIIKDDNEIDELKKNRIKSKKLNEVNYMTLDKFKEDYIYKSKEKGIYLSDKKSFINDMKIIRNLSQISYRILNYILYSNLFFARLITNKNEFDQYLPRGMKWVETLFECWNIIKNELMKENIYSVEEFMNYLFIELFPILNKEKNIDNYDDLIKLEDKLESIIQKAIKNYKEEGHKISSEQKVEDKEKDKNSFISLLKEKYSKSEYKIEDYPFYEYFYYTDYINEDYISKKLEQMYENKYPVLKAYIQNQNIVDKNKYSLNQLSLFNNVLNLIGEKYFNKISREFAEKNKIKDSEIYISNRDLIDKFISFYNNLNIKDDNNKSIKLTINNNLADFFIDDNNSIGRTYKSIYKEFINIQNNKLEPLLNIKIEQLVFDNNCKSMNNIQQIKEKDIFTLQLPKKDSIIDILFNSSYRKILDSDILSNKSYREYEINYDKLEENLTDSLLKNKKLLNEEITEFIYNNEVFSVQLTGFITLFNKLYATKNISRNDEEEIYKFTDENKNNINLSTNMSNDFVILLKYLNDKRRDNKSSDINEESKIYDIIKNNLKGSVSENFINIFEGKDGLTVDKTSNIFDYYLKTVSEDIINELSYYKEELNRESEISIDNYFNKKDTLFKKNEFACAIRLFASLVLLQEKDKENKIQNNRNNLVNYLKSPDLWNKDTFDSPDFTKNLNELKLCNIQINQVIPLYLFLGKDIDDNYFDDVKQRIENKEKEEQNNQINQNDNQDNEIDPFAEKRVENVDEEEEDPFGGDNADDEDDNNGNRD